MSQRELKKYLHKLNKEQLQEQLEDLYSRFKEVKTYYDFAFNPQENKLIEDAKQKIGKEYFPVNGRKAKMRRSIAQKFIKHFIQLGLDPMRVSDLMLFNIEIAQTFAAEREIKPDAFYISMFNSFENAVQFIQENGFYNSFSKRLLKIAKNAKEQNWFNYRLFEKLLLNNS
jgi:hypothetical protein